MEVSVRQQIEKAIKTNNSNVLRGVDLSDLDEFFNDYSFEELNRTPWLFSSFTPNFGWFIRMLIKKAETIDQKIQVWYRSYPNSRRSDVYQEAAAALARSLFPPRGGESSGNWSH